MADPITPLQLGEFLWSELAETFRVVLEQNAIEDRKQKAQAWAGFVAAASGAMSRDLGVKDATTVLEGVILALNTPKPKPTMKLVPLAGEAKR